MEPRLVTASDDFLDSVSRRPDVCPHDGWIGRYLTYAEAQTDAPSVYHLAVGLSIVSTVLGNRCWMRLYGGKVFPASWHVLLGDSSYMRKSTAIRLGVNLLEAMEGEDVRMEHSNQSRGVVIPSSFSKEGLEQAMQGRADGILPAWEFGELLAALNRDYMAGSKEQLTRWYDGDSSSRATARDGTRKVKDPAVTIIGASTPAWIEDRVKEGDVMGGFLARFNFWPATRAESNPWKFPLDSTWDHGTFNALTTSLQMMRAHREDFRLDDHARSMYRDWLYEHETSYGSSGFPPQLMGFHARLSTGLLKMAMALEAATEHRSMTISEATVKAAIRIADWLKFRVAALFTEELAFTPYAADQRKVTKLLAQGALTKRELLRKTKWPVDQLERTMRGLVDGGGVDQSESVPERGGHSLVTYRVSGDAR